MEMSQSILSRTRKQTAAHIAIFRPYADMIQGYRALAKEALTVTIRKMCLIKCVLRLQQQSKKQSMEIII